MLKTSEQRCYFYIHYRVWESGWELSERNQGTHYDSIYGKVKSSQDFSMREKSEEWLPLRGSVLKRDGGCLPACWKWSIYWSGDTIPCMWTYVKAHQAVYLMFVPFSACKQYLKRNNLREFSIIWESFPPAPVQAQSRCLRARWWRWRKAEITLWPTSGLCWGLFKGSYGSITQKPNLKRNSWAMSVWTKYSIEFIMFWLWPPPAYFWPQGQLKWCGP